MLRAQTILTHSSDQLKHFYIFYISDHIQHQKESLKCIIKHVSSFNNKVRKSKGIIAIYGKVAKSAWIRSKMCPKGYGQSFYTWFFFHVLRFEAVRNQARKMISNRLKNEGSMVTVWPKWQWRPSLLLLPDIWEELNVMRFTSDFNLILSLPFLFRHSSCSLQKI